MSTHDKILILEDDTRTRLLLERYLKGQGFAVVTASDGRRLVETMASESVKLIVLDLMLPGEDGLALCRKLRGMENDVPILMLSAKNDEVDKIVGLELGADDYLAKPFNPRELVARINAVLRRRQPPAAPGSPGQAGVVIQFGDFSLNLGTRQLWREGRKLPLTTGEFAVLEALATHPRQPLSREKLMDLARGRGHTVFDRSMDVQISRLRKLIEEDSSVPRYLQTVWGVGYVFVPDDRA
jgi:two-component system phosphate regulon response regulator OmpR